MFIDVRTLYVRSRYDESDWRSILPIHLNTNAEGTCVGLLWMCTLEIAKRIRKKADRQSV